MRGIPMLLCVVALAAILLMVGCTDGGSQGGQESHSNHSDNVKLELRSEQDSGVSGSASFKDTSGRVVVKLKLRALPKPNTFYLAHIHPGTCAEGEGHEHGGSHGEEGYGHDHGTSSREHGAEIEYPLSQVKSDSEGQGSSTTTLRKTSVDKLFSAEPKHVNVHEAGAGNPPILACADLKGVDQTPSPKSSVSAPDTKKETHHHKEVPAMLADEQMAKLDDAGRKQLLACQRKMVHEIWGQKQAAEKEMAFLTKQARKKGTTVQQEMWSAGYRCPEEVPGMENLEVE